MMRFFFHATDGFDVVFDTEGQRLLGRPMAAVAYEVAASVRGLFGPEADYADWIIAIQDEHACQVETYGFEELEREAEVLVAA